MRIWMAAWMAAASRARSAVTTQPERLALVSCNRELLGHGTG